MLNESLLQGMQTGAIRQPLDGHNFLTICLYCKDQAGVDRPAVQEDRAGPALSIVAASFRPGEFQVFPEEIQEGFFRLHGKIVSFTIYG
jgi:hypothetical protein